MSRFRMMSEARSELYHGLEQTAPSFEERLPDVRDVRNAGSTHHAYNAHAHTPKLGDVVFDVCYLHFDEKSLPGTPCVCLSTDRQVVK